MHLPAPVTESPRLATLSLWCESTTEVLTARPTPWVRWRAGEIGKALGVRYLLEGSVRKAGEQVRINVQLIDSTSGFQVWADDFTGEMKDVFSLQEQTALKIAQSLNLKLSPKEEEAIQHRYTGNPQAYDAYLRGQALVQYPDDPAKLEAARRAYEESLRSDPNYPLALAGLSWVEAQIYRNLDSTPAHLQHAEEYAQRALAIRNYPRFMWRWGRF